MPLTLLQLEGEVYHALGGNPAPEHTRVSIVNRAGQYLMTMHQWRFREGKAATVATVASQNYIELPDDFGGELLSITASDALNDSVTLVDLADIDMMRGSSVTVTSTSFWGALSTPANAYDRTRVELYPTPSSAVNLLVRYRMGWRELANDADKANVPVSLENLLIELVRVFARGIEQEDVASLGTRLAVLETEPVFISAVNSDGIRQPSYGPMRGTAMETSVMGGYSSLDQGRWSDVSDPA